MWSSGPLLLGIMSNSYLIYCHERKGSVTYKITVAGNSSFNSTGKFTGISFRFFNSFCLALVVPCIHLGPIGPTLFPGLTKRLGWLVSWTPTRTAFSDLELELLLNWPLTLELLLTVLFLLAPGPGLKSVPRGPQRDYRLSTSLKRDCWLVNAEMRIRIESRIRGYLPMPGYFETRHYIIYFFNNVKTDK
jgi:hypothetical protein